MKKIFTLLTIMATSFNSIAGDGAGNGGWVQDMLEADLRERKPITEEIILKLTEKNGLVLKKEILIPTMRSFLEKPNPELTEELSKLKSLLLPVKNELYEDIMYSPIRVGHCQINQSLCTGDTPYSDIIIDTNSTLGRAFGITFSEVIGLIAHEYTHHFVGDYDHPNYSFARFVRDNIKSENYGSKLFKLNDIIQPCENDSYKYGYCLLTAGNDALAQEQADIFCEQKGLKKANSYLFESIPGLDLARLRGVRIGNTGYFGSGLKYPTYTYKYTFGNQYRRLAKINSLYSETTPTRSVLTEIECGF